MVSEFIGLIHFKSYSHDKVGNIGILVVWGVCEKL